MFTSRAIGFVSSPYKAGSEIPKGLGAKHDADGVLTPFVTVQIARDLAAHLAPLISRRGAPLPGNGVTLFDQV